MQITEIYTELTHIFQDIFDDESIIVTPELTAADVPEWDSLNHINLVVAIEQRFKIKFQTAELEQMHAAGQLASLIDSKLCAQEG
jgi:acyl carrier protein